MARIGRLIGIRTLGPSLMAVPVAVLVAVAPPGCQSPPSPAPTATRSDPRVVREDDLQLFTVMLNDDGVPFAFRREAAIRLAESGGFDAAQAFRISWRDGDDRQRAMVLDAIRSSGSVGRQVVVAMLDAMLAGQVDLQDVAAILSFESGRELVTVRERLRTSTDAPDRVRYIDLLSRVPLPGAAEILVDAFPEARGDGERTALDTALQRWSNTGQSRDADGWRAWWIRLSLAEGDSTALQQLTDRLAIEVEKADRASTRATEAEARSRRLAIRLADLKTRTMAMLEGDARTEALREMFVDEEPMVRAAAISQVERMLRDARPIPELIREDLAVLIADEVPENRISSVKVLDAIGVEGLADTLASSLLSESNPEVVSTGLAVLGNRPNPVAIPLAMETLRRSDPSLKSAAARVVAEVAAAGLLHPDDRFQIRALIPEIDDVEDRNTARVWVLLADDEGLASARGLLRSDRESVRRGAAEGFRNLGLRELLREEASDPIVARAAVQAWIESPPAIDLINLEVLQELRPNEDTDQARSDFSTWQGAVTQILSEMPTDRLADAEGMLKGDVDLLDARCASLRRGLDATLVDAETRLRLQTLLLEAMREGERWTEAIAELRSLGATSDESPWRPMFFELLLRTQDWDGAAEVDASPAAWIELLEPEAPLDSSIRQALVQEIERRYGDDLEAGLRTRFDSIRNRVDQPDA